MSRPERGDGIFQADPPAGSAAARVKLQGIEMIRGGCLCGGVRYEISGELSEICFCHCQMCRRLHGTPFGSYAAVHPQQRRYTSGEALITRYQSSPDAVRTFCRRCGSKLSFENSATPDEIWIAAGTFDGDPGVRPGSHIFVDSKAPWFEITDDLKQSREDS